MDAIMKANQDGDPDFVWDDYMEDTDSIAAPPTAFSHVEHSLVSSLKIGMKLVVVNLEEEEKCFWVSSIKMICGPLLSLRYLGYGDDRTADFWFNLQVSEFHPVGWCNENKARLYPPRGIRERHGNYMSLIVPSLEEDTIPISILEDPESGITPIDQIKPDMLVEIADISNYEILWPARIIQNVGGRLLLRYVLKTDVEEYDFWLFYLSERLHPMEWAKCNNLVYQLPTVLKGKISLSAEEKNELLDSCFKEYIDYSFPVHILEPQFRITRHCFKERMKLEMLDPVTLLDFRVATVTKVISQYYFTVKIDTTKADNVDYPQVCCHASSTNIFPCNWAKENGLTIIPPGSEFSRDFNWAPYLSSCRAIAAPKELFLKPTISSKFKVNMKLEAVNPFLPKQIHVATLEKMVEPILWIRLDDSNKSGPSHVVACNSLDILPVGWCVSNAYPLQTPVFCKSKKKSEEVAPTVPSCASTSPSTSAQKERSGGKSWCPKIYFNHCCFTGPLLSKSRLAELPQAIGPGPLHLVMKDVLTRLINIAYKSIRVLKELQICGPPDPKMMQQAIKAKYKGKSYRSTVQFVRNSEQVEEFCRAICIKLDCCPHLFGPNHVGRDCPDDCNTLTKSKFSNGVVKRQKKTNGNTSPEDTSEAKRGPGRKRKRKHWRLVQALAANELAKNRERKEAEARGDSSSPKDHESPKTSDSEEESSMKKKLKESVPDSEQKNNPPAALKTESKDSLPSADKTEMPVPIVKKKGRPLGSTKKAMAASLASRRLALQREEHCVPKRSCRVLLEAEQMGLPGNPLYWSIDDVVKYIRSTSCAPMAYLLRDQEIDGTALMMLSLYDVQEFLHLKPEPAKKFCSLVEKIKYEFFVKFD